MIDLLAMTDYETARRDFRLEVPEYYNFGFEQQTAPYKYPREIEFRDALPKNHLRQDPPRGVA